MSNDLRATSSRSARSALEVLRRRRPVRFPRLLPVVGDQTIVNGRSPQTFNDWPEIYVRIGPSSFVEEDGDLVGFLVIFHLSTHAHRYI